MFLQNGGVSRKFLAGGSIPAHAEPTESRLTGTIRSVSLTRIACEFAAPRYDRSYDREARSTDQQTPAHHQLRLGAPAIARFRTHIGILGGLVRAGDFASIL